MTNTYPNSRAPFYERRPGVTATLALLAVIVIGVVIYAVVALTSGTRGQINQNNQINNATNRTFQYQHFFDLDADIHSESGNLQTALATQTADSTAPIPNDPIAQQAQQTKLDQDQQNVTGLEQLCTTNVNQYNADAQEFTRDRFLSNRLPSTESLSLCKGSTTP